MQGRTPYFTSSRSASLSSPPSVASPAGGVMVEMRLDHVRKGENAKLCSEKKELEKVKDWAIAKADAHEQMGTLPSVFEFEAENLKSAMHLLLLALSAVASAGSAEDAPVRLDVDYAAFLGKHDLLWDFRWSPGEAFVPTKWYMSAYVGDGSMGALLTVKNSTCSCPLLCSPTCACPTHIAGCEKVAAGGTAKLRLDINRQDAYHIHTPAPHGTGGVGGVGGSVGGVNEPGSGVTTPIGHLLFDTGLPWGGAARLRFRLSLHGAEIRGNATNADGTVAFSFRALVASGRDDASTSVLLFESSGDGVAPPTYVPCPATAPRSSRPNFDVAEQCVPSTRSSLGGSDVWVQTQTGGRATGPPADPWGSNATCSLAVAVRREGNLTVLTSANSCHGQAASASAAQRASDAAAKAAAVGGAAALVSAHRAWWADFWLESLITLGGGPMATRVEGVYFANMYRYSSAARVGMHDLTAAFGPGGMSMQWGSFVWDMNVQVNLFAVHASNHRSLVEPLLDALDTFVAQNQTTWAPLFAGNSPSGWSLLWVLKSFWKATVYLHDVKRRSGTLFTLLASGVDGLQLKDDGPGKHVHVLGIGSPEYPGVVDKVDTNFALAIARWGCRTLLQIAAEFPAKHEGHPTVTKCKSVLPRLQPFGIDATGMMLDQHHDFILPHRHWSHIISIYDFQLEETRFNASEPDSVASQLVRRSIDHWTGITCNDTLACPNSCRGFSRGATTIFSAMLGRAEAVRGNLTKHIQQVITPNGMYGEGVTANAPLFTQENQLSRTCSCSGRWTCCSTICFR